MSADEARAQREPLSYKAELTKSFHPQRLCVYLNGCREIENRQATERGENCFC